jgi:hypothetical protein
MKALLISVALGLVTSAAVAQDTQPTPAPPASQTTPPSQSTPPDQSTMPDQSTQSGSMSNTMETGKMSTHHARRGHAMRHGHHKGCTCASHHKRHHHTTTKTTKTTTTKTSS